MFLAMPTLREYMQRLLPSAQFVPRSTRMNLVYSPHRKKRHRRVASRPIMSRGNGSDKLGTLASAVLFRAVSVGL